ncbi:MAG: basic amino acid ABC transporter substrate-binding protein [Spirochaetaceae bacterium 4572_7]|nr:MAG: basic amino acid ABC transporter substrate-binding protein [Spirochaetaceae bacterium 4572_7]
MKRNLMMLVVAVLLTTTLVAKSNNEETITMGTNAYFPPFESIGGASGDEIVGFDVEIAKAIAQKAGLKLEIKDLEFDTLLTALNAEKVDFVIAGMTITEKRAKSVNFSTPYYEATQAVIVQTSNNDIVTKDDIKNKKIAVQLGTTGNGVADDFSKSVTAFNTGFEAIMELKNGKVDLIIIDEQPALAFLKKNSDLKIVEMKFEPEFYGIAVKKGNLDTLEIINATLQELKSSGKYDELMSEFMK